MESHDALEAVFWSAVQQMGAIFVCIPFMYAFKLHSNGIPLKKNSFVAALNAADCLTAVPMFGYMAYEAVNVAMDLYGSGMRFDISGLESRCLKPTERSQAMVLMITARMFGHMPVQVLELWTKPSLLMQMTAHHVLAGVCMANCLLAGQFHFYAALCVATEATTVWLSALQGTLCFSTGKGPLSAVFKAIFGVGLWLSFIIFRGLNFTFFFYMYFRDGNAHWQQLREHVSLSILVGNAVATAIVAGLSVMWFIAITKGMFKALRVILGAGGGSINSSSSDTTTKKVN